MFVLGPISTFSLATTEALMVFRRSTSNVVNSRVFLHFSQSILLYQPLGCPCASVITASYRFLWDDLSFTEYLFRRILVLSTHLWNSRSFPRARPRRMRRDGFSRRLMQECR